MAAGICPVRPPIEQAAQPSPVKLPSHAWGRGLHHVERGMVDPGADGGSHSSGLGPIRLSAARLCHGNRPRITATMTPGTSWICAHVLGSPFNIPPRRGADPATFFPPAFPQRTHATSCC